MRLMAQRMPPDSEHPFFRHKKVLVIAHRGGGGLWPENTLYAFEHAVRMGADALETDIRRTRDGQIVLLHDPAVDRTTNGTGPVRQLGLSEVRKLCAAHHWSPDKGRSFPLRGSGITIPTLAEVFAAFPDIRIHIDIKEQTPDIIQPLCRMIREHGKTGEVLVGSFHTDILSAFRQACPEVATSATKTEIRRFHALSRIGLGSLYAPRAGAIQVPDALGNMRVVTRRFAEDAHRHGMKVYVWTVNETGNMRHLLDMGTDGIITDFPDRLLKCLGRPL